MRANFTDISFSQDISSGVECQNEGKTQKLLGNQLNPSSVYHAAWSILFSAPFLHPLLNNLSMLFHGWPLTWAPTGHVQVTGVSGCPKGPASVGKCGVCVQLSVGSHVTSWLLYHFNLTIVLIVHLGKRTTYKLKYKPLSLILARLGF